MPHQILTAWAVLALALAQALALLGLERAKSQRLPSILWRCTGIQFALALVYTIPEFVVYYRLGFLLPHNLKVLKCLIVAGGSIVLLANYWALAKRWRRLPDSGQ